VTSTDLFHPAISAALSATATLLGMEVVYIGGLTEDTFTFERVLGQEWPGVEEGRAMPRTDSLCSRLLAGGPPATANIATDPTYRDCTDVTELGICSYVGVPIIDRSGRTVGTLCGIDRGEVAVDGNTVAVLTELAGVIAAHLEPTAGAAVIRRTPKGWQVADAEPSDLTSAMVLADMLAADLDTGGRPPRPQGELTEVDQLRLAVTQLEHALAARVVVEQAIGVLAERQRLTPRASFERLRRAARSRGRRVHDLAREVVGSAGDTSVPLPPELAGRR
jgi:hypothetical protein